MLDFNFALNKYFRLNSFQLVSVLKLRSANISLLSILSAVTEIKVLLF